MTNETESYLDHLRAFWQDLNMLQIATEIVPYDLLYSFMGYLMMLSVSRPHSIEW
jgi:hypothetical protein